MNNSEGIEDVEAVEAIDGLESWILASRLASFDLRLPGDNSRPRGRPILDCTEALRFLTEEGSWHTSKEPINIEPFFLQILEVLSHPARLGLNFFDWLIFKEEYRALLKKMLPNFLGTLESRELTLRRIFYACEKTMSRLVNVLESRKERAFETYVLGVISERPTIVDRWSSETNDRLLTQVFNSRPVDSSWASESVVNLARNTEQLVRRGSSLKGFHQDLSVGYIAACKEFGVYLASVYLYFMQAEPKNGVITVRSFLDLLQELIDLEET